jgi:hypothetical protein
MRTTFVIASCFIFTLFSYNSFSQRNTKDCIGLAVGKGHTSKVPTDTVRPASFGTGADTLYGYVEGGYSFGTSMLGDRAFAQEYKVNIPYIVEGVALWMGAKQQIGTADTLNVIIYKLDGPGTAADTSGIVYINNAPDSTDHLLQITTNLIDTAGLTFLTFPMPYIAYVDYAAGIDFSQINDDTLGLVTTRFGDADSTQLSWDKWSDNTWHTVLEPLNWGKDLDLGIFMIVDKSSANISDNYFIDKIKLSQNQPNPVSGSTLIQYEIQNVANVALEIYDLSGRLVLTCNEGRQEAGKHDILVDSGKLAQGSYFYSLKADNHRLTKKMSVIK